MPWKNKKKGIIVFSVANMWCPFINPYMWLCGYGGGGVGLRLCLFMVDELCGEATGTYYVNNSDLGHSAHIFLCFGFV